MFGMNKTRNAGLIIGAAVLVLLAARGARGLLWHVVRMGGCLFVLIGIAAVVYGFSGGTDEGQAVIPEPAEMLTYPASGMIPRRRFYYSC